MKTWGRGVCVERTGSCWDGQGRGFRNSPPKRWQENPECKAQGGGSCIFLPQIPSAPAAGSWGAPVSHGNLWNIQKSQEASLNDEDGMNQGLLLPHPFSMFAPQNTIAALTIPGQAQQFQPCLSASSSFNPCMCLIPCTLPFPSSITFHSLSGPKSFSEQPHATAT